MLRARRKTLRLVLLSVLTVLAGVASVRLGGSLHDLLLVAGAALVTLLSVTMLSPREEARRAAVAGTPGTAAEADRAGPAGPARLSAAGRHPEGAALEQAVDAFQAECSNLLLDAEAARVQTESCAGGVRAVDQASRSLAATCDVLGRRAGLTQSHALMARCATADAAECLQQAMVATQGWRQSMETADAADELPADRGERQRLGAAASDSLERALAALNAALERGDESARVAAELGGAAARGQRHALNLSEACAGLAPSLDESARTGMRLAMLAASLDENAGRVARMLGAAASGPRRPRLPEPTSNWRGVAGGGRARATEASDNIVYVRFRGTRGKPDAELA